MEIIKENKIALLIDGDNAQSKLIHNILAEAGKHGKVTIRRVYGNWTDSRLNGWKEQINKHSIRPIQKFSIAQGKNSTDTALIIDAMDILHSGNVTGFCIASSDSDFTGLAQRIREEGVFVMGIGEANKTSESFVNACDLFVFSENLLDDDNSKNKVNDKPKAKKVTVISGEIVLKPKIEFPINKLTKKPLELDLVMKAFEMAVNDNGLAYMGEIGTALRKLEPSFDTRTYGSATMTALFKRMPDFFELSYQDNGSSL
jgi:uncharacterized LabA/DUF88 family protein